MKIIILFIVTCCLISCSSIKPLGTIGPKKLQVYTISDNDFLSASRMIVIIDHEGNVIASTGSTVQGFGALATQMLGSFAIASSIITASKHIQHGVENAQVTTTIKGVPTKYTLITDHTFHLK